MLKIAWSLWNISQYIWCAGKTRETNALVQILKICTMSDIVGSWTLIGVSWWCVLILEKFTLDKRMQGPMKFHVTNFQIVHIKYESLGKTLLVFIYIIDRIYDHNTRCTASLKNLMKNIEKYPVKYKREGAKLLHHRIYFEYG